MSPAKLRKADHKFSKSNRNGSTSGEIGFATNFAYVNTSASATSGSASVHSIMDSNPIMPTSMTMKYATQGEDKQNRNIVLKSGSESSKPSWSFKEPLALIRSRTRTIASATDLSGSSNSLSISSSSRPTPERPQLLPRPQTDTYTAAEEYWARRALRAEWMLSHSNTADATMKGKERQKTDLSHYPSVCEDGLRHKKLESVVAILFVTLISLIAFIIYRLTDWNSLVHTVHQLRFGSPESSNSHPRQSSGREARSVSGWSFQLTNNFYLPSHFTIPILSPFASVVENETNHSAFGFGTRFVSLCIVTLGLLAYFVFRYWMGLRSTAKVSG